MLASKEPALAWPVIRKPDFDSGPATKECNSRVTSHFGTQNWRCYNRATANFLVNAAGFRIHITGSFVIMRENLLTRRIRFQRTIS